MQSFVVKESLNSVTVFWLKQEKLLKALHKAAQEIGKKDSNILKVVLFGSLAERRGIPGSDADILIILKKDKRPFMDRIVEFSRKFSVGFPIEVFPYTQEEQTISFVQHAIKQGIILFER